jgi:serum/glucocorticoid-regulated kinase 2
VLENKGHGKGIDWWSLGTLMYEMVCGLPPFYDQSVQKMYKKILTQPLAPPKNMGCVRGAVTKYLKACDVRAVGR